MRDPVTVGLYVQVRPSTEGQPDGPVELQVKDKTVVLSVDEAAALANALLAYVPLKQEPIAQPEPTDATPA